MINANRALIKNQLLSKILQLLAFRRSQKTNIYQFFITKVYVKSILYEIE